MLSTRAHWPLQTQYLTLYVLVLDLHRSLPEAFVPRRTLPADQPVAFAQFSAFNFRFPGRGDKTMKTARFAWLAFAAFAVATVPAIRSGIHAVTVRDITNPPPSVVQPLADITNPPPSVSQMLADITNPPPSVSRMLADITNPPPAQARVASLS